jgi:hypothetical protein
MRQHTVHIAPLTVLMMVTALAAIPDRIEDALWALVFAVGIELSVGDRFHPDLSS